MSGRRPVNLSRRGAVYVVRLGIPKHLQGKLGISEIRRSLHTKDMSEAKRRCADAQRWFGKLMDRMMAERSLSRVDIEAAANRYFFSLINNHGPLEDVSANPADTTAYNLEMNAGRLEALDFQFQNNKFDGEVEATARSMLRAVGFEFDSLAPDLAKIALTLE